MSFFSQWGGKEQGKHKCQIFALVIYDPYWQYFIDFLHRF